MGAIFYLSDCVSEHIHQFIVSFLGIKSHVELSDGIWHLSEEKKISPNTIKIEILIFCPNVQGRKRTLRLRKEGNT